MHHAGVCAGLSPGFQSIYFDEIAFPARMLVDYVRVYQKKGEKPRISCDPTDHPTANRISSMSTAICTLL